MTWLMPTTSLYAEAAEEEYYLPTEIPINTNWWGLDSHGNVNDSFGLHRKNAGAWAVWSAASFPDTVQFCIPNCPNPFIYVSKRLWSAFQVHQ